MFIYHLHIASKYVITEKWIFHSRDNAVKFIQDYMQDIRFINEEAKLAWQDHAKTNSEALARSLLFTLTEINTEVCPRWSQLFRGKLFRVGDG